MLGVPSMLTEVGPAYPGPSLDLPLPSLVSRTNSFSPFLQFFCFAFDPACKSEVPV